MSSLDRGLLLHERGALQPAAAAFRRALAQARREEDGITQALALNALGAVYVDLDRPVDAKRSLEKALVLVRGEIDEPNELEGAILHNLGNALLDSAEPEEALARYSEALEIQRGCAPAPAIAATLGNLARLRARGGRIEEAAEDWKEALALHRRGRDREGEQVALIELGGLLVGMGLAGEGHDLFTQALALAERRRSPVHEAAARMGLGESYAYLGELEAAVNEWGQVVLLTRELGDQVNEAGAEENLGNTCHRLGRLEEARKHMARAIELRREVGDPGDLQRALRASSEIHAAAGRRREALEQLERSLRLAEETVPGWTRGHSHHRLAVSSLDQARPETAKRHLVEALRLAREAGDHGLEANSLQALGEACRRLGDPAEAEEHFAEAVRGLRRLGDEFGVAETRFGLARLYEEQGRPDEAAAALRRAMAVHPDLRGRLKILSALGWLAARSGRHEEAAEQFREAVAVARSAGDRAGEGEALLDLGHHQRNRMRLEEALKPYHDALAAFQATGDRHQEGLTLGLIRDLYSALGLEDEAREWSQRAAEVLEEVARGPAAGSISLHLTLAGLLGDLDAHHEAADHLQQALTLARERRDREREGEALMALARLHWELGQLAAAVERCVQAGELARQAGRAGEESDRQRFLAQLLRVAGDAETSRRTYRRALSLAREVGHWWGEVDALWGLGALDMDRRELGSAREHFDTAIALVEASRSEVLSPELRASHFGVHQELYRNAIRLAVDQDDPAWAFHLAERRSARGLLDLLAELRGEIHQDLDADLREREGRLAAELAALEELRSGARLDPRAPLLKAGNADPQLAGAPSGEWKWDRELREQELRSRERALEAEWRAHDAEVRRRNPRFHALVQPSALDFETVRRELLDDETALLVYVLDEPQSLLLVVLQEGVHSLFLPAGDEILSMARALRLAVGDPKLAAAEDDSLARRLPGAFELYRALVAPAESFIGGRRLVVIADGDLHLLPFGVLLRKPPVSGQGFRDLDFLARHHAISLVPSASAACELKRLRRARQRPWDQEFVAFGDPSGPGADGQADAAGRLASPLSLARHRSGERAWAPLKFARAEVARIAALFDEELDLGALEDGSSDHYESRRVSIRLGHSATKQAVRSRFGFASGLPSSRFVHFATHGWAHPGTPRFSWLLLAPGPTADPLWHTVEISNTRIDAELVVLSACETGVGRIVHGEGLVSLARGFFHAGATSVCATLWAVDDSITAEIMTAFYRHLLGGLWGDGDALDKAEALRRAQIEAINLGGLTADPFYWSPFVLIGDWT